jgi:hypothetical protein
MNNEPVAVVDHRQQNGVTWLNIKKGRSVMPEHNTLLYTHPTKTLTDEEIKAVYGKYFDVENCDWLHLQCIHAILKKASEK